MWRCLLDKAKKRWHHNWKSVIRLNNFESMPILNHMSTMATSCGWFEGIFKQGVHHCPSNIYWDSLSIQSPGDYTIISGIQGPWTPKLLCACFSKLPILMYHVILDPGTSTASIFMEISKIPVPRGGVSSHQSSASNPWTSRPKAPIAMAPPMLWPTSEKSLPWCASRAS
jgi:hypothetical protein